MKKPPLPVRRLPRAVVVAGLLLAGSSLPAADPAPGATLKLDTVTVTATQDYRPLEDGWQVGTVPGFLVFSHGNAAVTTVVEQLQLARAAFALVWKDEALVRRPMTVVVTADEPDFRAWARVPAFDMDLTLRVVATSSGPVLVVNGQHDAVHRAVGRGYVLAQLRDTKLPRWLQEGMAQVINSAEAEGDHLRVGRVQQDPRNTVSLAAVREAAMVTQMSMPTDGGRFGQIGAEGGTVPTNARGDAVDIRINGMTPTWHELAQHLDEEQRRRLEERHSYTPTGDFLSHLADGMTMPLRQVFEPDAPDTVTWRMNAWAFTHYSLFGEKQRHRENLFKFVQQLGREPARAPVDVLADVYGMPAGKLELQLSLYAKGSVYRIFDFKLAEPFNAEKAAMASVPEANVLQLRARVFGATGRAEEARKILAYGYANAANRTPSYISQFVALERAHDPARASELLEHAAQREQLDNPGRRLLAAARLERLQHTQAKLQPQDLNQVLGPLFAALNQGDQSEELFVLIGRAWAASAVPPKQEHLNALRLGLTFHPKSRQLAELLRQLEQS
jgi:hypothetical protein